MLIPETTQRILSSSVPQYRDERGGRTELAATMSLWVQTPPCAQQSWAIIISNIAFDETIPQRLLKASSEMVYSPTD